MTPIALVYDNNLTLIKNVDFKTRKHRMTYHYDSMIRKNILKVSLNFYVVPHCVIFKEVARSYVTL